MTLPPESLEALRRAAARRADVSRLVLVERRVQPRSEDPFVDRTLVVLLDELPSEPRAFEQMQGLASLFAPALRGSQCAIRVPSPAGLESATRDAVVVYDRNAG